MNAFVNNERCRRRVLCRVVVALVLLGLSVMATCRADDPGGSLRLTLPAECFAVVGEPMNIYYDNIVLTKTPADYRFRVTGDIGTANRSHWTVTPTAADVGTHRLTVTVADSGGTILGRADTTLRVVAANAGDKRSIRLLIVGDSLTHATLYPNQIAKLLSRPGNPTWTMLGTHKTKRAAKGVVHEGYGGWTWERFVSHYEPHPDGTYKKRSSPFVFLGHDGKPGLDVARYFKEKCGGQRPDFVIVMLGINDCFHVNPDDRRAVDSRIDKVFTQADKLLAAFRRAAPRAELGICLTTPPNAREVAFQANYKGRYHRWGWKRIQHRLVRREIDHFASNRRAGTFLIPTELNLDPVGGYPDNNGVHPNPHGYQQIGTTIYAWLKSRLEKRRR